MYDVVIVGAGPAGLSAAIKCANYGLQVKIIDEFIKPGGRLLGQLHEEPDGTWWNGINEAKHLYQTCVNLGVQIDCGIAVCNIEKKDHHWSIHTSNYSLDATSLLLATGAAETAIPVPGWTLPGVMSIGAAQVMTNIHRVKVGQKGIIIGVNVLATAIARELQLAGITITNIMLPSLNNLSRDSGHPRKTMESLLKVAHLAPSPFIRFGSKLMKYSVFQNIGMKAYPKKGMKMWNIPIHLKKAATQIIGEDQVEAVKIVTIDDEGLPIPGTEEVIAADFVCIAGGLYPLAELASLAGCPFYFIPELGGHIPLHNEKMETTLDGLFVAGNITGIESAKVAIAQGNVAGLSICNSFFPSHKKIKSELDEAIQAVENTRKLAIIQFHPKIDEGRRKLQSIWNETIERKNNLTV